MPHHLPAAFQHLFRTSCAATASQRRMVCLLQDKLIVQESWLKASGATTSHSKDQDLHAHADSSAQAGHKGHQHAKLDVMRQADCPSHALGSVRGHVQSCLHW